MIIIMYLLCSSRHTPNVIAFLDLCQHVQHIAYDDIKKLKKYMTHMILILHNNYSYPHTIKFNILCDPYTSIVLTNYHTISSYIII